MRTYKSFVEFWPFYLGEHSRPRTRALHYAGSLLAILLLVGGLVTGIVTGDWRLLIGVPVAGYAFAWTAHAAVEHNRPATFTYPLWSLAADFRMLWLWLTGRLEPELRRAGIVSEEAQGALGDG